MDIVGRKLMFVTIGTGNFFLSRKWSRRAIVCLWGWGERGKFFHCLDFVPFSDSGTWFLMPGLLDSSALPCCLLNSFIYLNFMYFTIMTSKWTELITNLPQEPQAIKPSKFSEYFVFMLQRFSTLVQNDEINIFEIFAALIAQDWIFLLLLGFALSGKIITTIFISTEYDDKYFRTHVLLGLSLLSLTGINATRSCSCSNENKKIDIWHVQWQG